ncbi:MAG: peptidylprolyl isomerase [Candidatus Eisenbacteria bacterium]
MIHRERLLPVIALLLLSPAGFGEARAAGAGDRLATVNGEDITVEDLNRELAAFGAVFRKGGEEALPSPDGLLRRLIQNRLLEQEGYRIGADSLPAVRNQVRELRRHKGMMALLDSVSNGVAEPTEAELDSFTNVSNIMNRVSHILVTEKEEARALRESLETGVSFGDLAARHSLDSTSAKKMGDLGWAREGRFVPEFEEAVRSLEPGGTAGPVKTQFGWHLVRLVDRREENLGTSEEMRGAIKEAIMKDRVMFAVRSFTESVREKYGMVVDDSLLASLDYGSEDPKVQEYLRTSEDTLAHSPIGFLTVKGLTKSILYVYFHGLAGKPNANEVRDKMFEEYFSEALLSYEASVLGFLSRDDILRHARALERGLLREEVLRLILGVPFEPEEKEVEEFYSAHSEAFMPKPRIKVSSVLLADLSSAAAFREMVEKGAKLKWLSERAEGVVEVGPPSFSGWIEPSLFDETDAADMNVVGPVETEGGFVVGVVDAVERVSTPPLAECRHQVLREMRNRRNQELIKVALERLEGASETKIAPGAEEVIAERIRAWVPESGVGGGAETPASSANTGSGG